MGLDRAPRAHSIRYAFRSTRVGSRRDARLAGSHPAKSPTAKSVAADAVNVRGSHDDHRRRILDAAPMNTPHASREGRTIVAIRAMVRRGRLTQPFNAAAVNAALGIPYGGTFLAKHCDRRPDRAMTHLFDRVTEGRYRLTTQQQARCDAGQ
jgi:hypothetical protein